MKPHYRISFKDISGNYYHPTNSNGAYVDTTPLYFYRSYVTNWSEMGIIDERNSRMFGFTRSYTEDNYQFVKIARQIVGWVWLNGGSNAYIELYVEVLDQTINDYVFDYKSAIDLATASLNRDTLSAKLLDDGIEAKVKSREDITYEIPIDSTTGYRTIEILPMNVLGACKLLTTWPCPGDTSTGSKTVSGTTSAYKVPFFYVDKTLVSVSDTPGNQPISFSDPALNNFVSGQDFELFNAGTGMPVNDDNYIIKANVPIRNVKFRVRIRFHINNTSGFAGNYTATLSKMNAAGTAYTIIQQFTTATILSSGMLNDYFDFNTLPFNMAVGESLILYFSFSVASAGANTHDFAIEKDTPLNISFEHYTDSYTVTGLSWYRAGIELIKRITDGDATFQSQYLTTLHSFASQIDLQPQNLMILSGDSVRGSDNPVLKITLKDYLKASMVMMGLGFGVEGNKCVLEPIAYFMKADSNSLIAEINEVSEIPEITPATDFHFNQLQIGYKEYEYDGLNGRDEPNTITEYLLPTTNEKKLLDMVSPVRADGYGIFDTWVNYALSENKDSKSDNSLFALQVKPRITGTDIALYYTDINPTGVVSGVLDPARTMNIGLTPRKCAQRLGSFLQSCFYGQDDEVLKYQSTTRNSALVTRLSTTIAYAENVNIPLKSLPPRIFQPFYISVSCKSPTNYRALWAAKPNGYFRIKAGGKTYNGFPWRTQDTNAKPKLRELKLLAMPNNSPLTWL